MSYKAILFDLDNTLIDFTQAEELSLHAIYSHYFQNFVDSVSFKKNYHSINKKLWAQVEKGELTTAHVKVERFRLLVETLQLSLDHLATQQHYENSLVEYSRWYPGVKEALVDLKKQYQLGIVTNGLGYVQQGKFSALGIQQFCECYVVSELVGFAKPGKEIFEIALNQLKLQPHDVLMVGDSLSSDYLGAINAGIDFCWVNNRNEVLPAGLSSPKYHVESVTQLPSLL